MEDRHRPKTRDGFRIAILCALPREASAVRALFDEEWEGAASSYGKGPNDHNAYSFGWLSGKLLVLAYASMGKVAAANASKDLKASFRNIGLLLVVGVCGGAPKNVENGTDIHLGDVAVSTQVIQDDFGRRYDDRFIRKAEAEFALTRASPEIRNFLAKLAATKEQMVERTNGHLIEVMQHPETCSLHTYPGIDQDKLFRSDYRHKHREKEQSPSSSDECPQLCSTCRDCATSQDAVCEDALKATCSQLGCNADGYQMRSTSRHVSVVAAVSPQNKIRHVEIHFGRIISTDSVIKSASYRDEAISREGVIAFEMESAGAWENAPTILVKGVVDYADSHKNKDWQGFAALSAAACAKTIVEEWALESEPREDRITPSDTPIHTTAMYRDLLTALDPVDPDSSLMDAKARTRAGSATEGTCQWLFGSKTFETGLQLLTTASSCFPASQASQRTTGSTVAYFFCDNKLEQRRTVLSILRSLLYQILNRFPHLCQPIQQKFDVFRDKLFKDFSSIWPWFERTLSEYNLGEIYIVLDALDECEETNRVELIRGLCSLLGRRRSAATNHDRLKLLVLTRPTLIAELLGNHCEEWHITLDRETIKDDLEIYVEKEVEALVQRRRWSQGTHEAIQSELKSRHGGTFLWVALVVKNIAQPKVREHEVLEVLKQFPSGLTDVYIRILREINEVEPEYAPFVLQYVLAPVLPFPLERELSDTEASVLLHFRHKAEPGSRLLPSLEELKRLGLAVRACELLLRSDHEWGLEFLHQSVKDFLTGQDLPSDLLRYRMSEKKASAAYQAALKGYLEAAEFEQLAMLDRRILKTIPRAVDGELRRQMEAVSSQSFGHLTKALLKPLQLAWEKFRERSITEWSDICRVFVDPNSSSSFGPSPQLLRLLTAAAEQGQTTMIEVHLLIWMNASSALGGEQAAVVASMIIESLRHGHSRVAGHLFDLSLRDEFPIFEDVSSIIIDTMTRVMDDENVMKAYMTFLEERRAYLEEHGIDDIQVLRLAIFTAGLSPLKQLMNPRCETNFIKARELHALSGCKWLVFRCREIEDHRVEELVIEPNRPTKDCTGAKRSFKPRSLAGDKAQRFCDSAGPSKCSLVIRYRTMSDGLDFYWSETGAKWSSNLFRPRDTDSIFESHFWSPLDYALDLWRTCRDERRREVASYLAKEMKNAELLTDNDYKVIVEEFEAAKDNTVVDKGLDRHTTTPFDKMLNRDKIGTLLDDWDEMDAPLQDHDKIGPRWHVRTISRTKAVVERLLPRGKSLT